MAVKEYDVISIGTGSAMNIVSPMIQANPDIKIAVIDKDDPGGICLTRGCIPTKILLYPAELVTDMRRAGMFGLDVDVTVDFVRVMRRMRDMIDHDIDGIRRGLSNAKNIDYYNAAAEFVAPYTMQVGGETVKAPMIFLCTGSQVALPPVEGLAEVGYHTSDTILHITELPKSIAILGGGYIAAEFGHFLAAMGSRVTIVGRNPRFLPGEEPEVSELAKRELSKRMRVVTGHEVRKARRVDGQKEIVAVNGATNEVLRVRADELLVATGRGTTSGVLKPQKGGVRTDEKGWIAVDEHLQTSQPNVWAMGDATGVHLFKHKANYDSQVVYYNAVLKRPMKADYHAVPHAVFTHPEIAAVGLREAEAVAQFGQDQVLIGFWKYEDMAKGEAMGVTDYFVKVILHREGLRILGAHMIGPQASVLIQQLITLMYTADQSAKPAMQAMYIHPAMPEVVQRAFNRLLTPAQYRGLREGKAHHH